MRAVPNVQSMETGHHGVYTVTALLPVEVVCRHGPGPVPTQPLCTVAISALETTQKMLFVIQILIAQLMVVGHSGEIGASVLLTVDGVIKNVVDFVQILYQHMVVTNVKDHL